MLCVWLPLNGDSRNQGLNSLTLSGAPTSWDNNGKIGKCANFTGNLAYILYNNTTKFNYLDNFSWTIWIKTNYTGTTT